MRAVCSPSSSFFLVALCATYAVIQRYSYSYKIHNILFNSFMHSIRFNGQSQTMNLIQANIIFQSLSTRAREYTITLKSVACQLPRTSMEMKIS